MVAKLALIGNTTKDIVYVFDKFKIGSDNKYVKQYISEGGIFNLLSYLRDKLIIDIFPSDYSEIIVLVDKENSERTFVSSEKTVYKINYQNFCDYDWCHVAYLDNLDLRIEDILLLKRHSKTLSCDLCFTDFTNKQASYLMELFKYFDYVFMSIDNLNALYTHDILSVPKKYWGNITFIIHSSDYVLCINKDEKIFDYRFPELENLNTLGAGDVFAANVIYNRLLANSLEDSIKNACHLTTKFLIERS